MVQCDGQRERWEISRGGCRGNRLRAGICLETAEGEAQTGRFSFFSTKISWKPCCHIVTNNTAVHCKCFQIPDLCDICILPRDLYLHTYVQKVDYF